MNISFFYTNNGNLRFHLPVKLVVLQVKDKLVILSKVDSPENFREHEKDSEHEDELDLKGEECGVSLSIIALPVDKHAISRTDN